MGHPLSEREEEEVRAMIMTMSYGDMSRSLVDMASREKSLLEGPAGEDEEMRQITLWNVAVLCAAAEQVERLDGLIPDQKDPPGS